MIPVSAWYQHDMALAVLGLSGNVMILILVIVRKAMMLTYIHKDFMSTSALFFGHHN